MPLRAPHACCNGASFEATFALPAFDVLEWARDGRRDRKLGTSEGGAVETGRRGRESAEEDKDAAGRTAGPARIE